MKQCAVSRTRSGKKVKKVRKVWGQPTMLLCNNNHKRYEHKQRFVTLCFQFIVSKTNSRRFYVQI